MLSSSVADVCIFRVSIPCHAHPAVSKLAWPLRGTEPETNNYVRERASWKYMQIRRVLAAASSYNVI